MIPLFKVHLPESVDKPLLDVLHGGFIGQGPKVEEFEAQLKVKLANPYILTTNSGTSAIQLALRLADVGPGDEVMCTAMTCTASNMPVLATGAKIVWADINPKTGNIDPDSIISNMSTDTKVIIPVHYGGYPCDMDEIRHIAGAFNLRVIEDAAHAFGAEYRGIPIGQGGDFTCFSFQAIKHLTTVDGGLLCCSNEEDYRRGKLLRWYGISREDKNRKDFRCENDIESWGYKFNMHDVSACIGIEQLKYVDGLIQRSRENAVYYDTQFKEREIKSVKPLEYDDSRWSSYWLYVVKCDNRDGFVAFMNERGIQVSQVHKRNDVHSCFAAYKPEEPLRGVDEFSSRQCALPVGWWLSREDRQYIMDKIGEWENKHGQ